MNISDISRDRCMLTGPLAKRGYDWWWHSFTAENAETGERKSFYIEYFLCNPAHAKDEPVIVWNDPNKRDAGIRPSYLMVNVGHWGSTKAQIHRFFPWQDVQVDFGVPFCVEADDCLCTETHIKGSVSVSSSDVCAHSEWMSDAGQMSWDISVNKKVAYNVGYGASSFFRRLNAFEMFWHAEGMKTEYDGWIVLDGQRYIVRPETCFGYADKNWGGDFTTPWVWLSSCDLVSKVSGKRLANSVFEVGGGCPVAFGIPLGRKLLGQFFYEGTDYEFNFSKFWTGSRTRFSCKETEDKIIWHVVQSTFKAKMEVDIECSKDEMLLINYESPDGFKRHNRLWNCGNGEGAVRLYRRENRTWALVDDAIARSVGCEYGEYDAPGPYGSTKS